MEMIQIGRDRLKVMMSKPDMCEYELNCDNMDGDDFHTRYALKRILVTSNYSSWANPRLLFPSYVTNNPSLSSTKRADYLFNLTKKYLVARSTPNN